MQLYRNRHFQNGQMWLGFSRTPPRLPDISKLTITEREVRGEALMPLTICSPNNWLRRLFYAFGASRRMTRGV